MKFNETASRRRRRSREERGLPAEQSRIDLAKTYLKIQQAKWPDLAADGDRPGLSEESAVALADDFRRRFLSAEPVDVIRAIELPEGVTLGSAYLRYSCDNSNPRSLAQHNNVRNSRFVRKTGQWMPALRVGRGRMDGTL